MSERNKQGIGTLPFLNLPLGRQPKMWKKRLQLVLSAEDMKKIGVAEAPSTKLSQYIMGHARGLDDWFVTIEGGTAGISLNNMDVGTVKACRHMQTLTVHGIPIISDEITLVLYSI